MTKKVKLTEVKGIYPKDADQGKDNRRINMVFIFKNENNYSQEASFALWQTDEKDFIVRVLKALGYIGNLDALLSGDKDTDWSLLFPKLYGEGIEAEIESNEYKGKTYWRISKIDKDVSRSATNTIDKQQFVSSFGFIDSELPNEYSKEEPRM